MLTAAAAPGKPIKVERSAAPTRSGCLPRNRSTSPRGTNGFYKQNRNILCEKGADLWSVPFLA